MKCKDSEFTIMQAGLSTYSMNMTWLMVPFWSSYLCNMYVSAKIRRVEV